MDSIPAGSCRIGVQLIGFSAVWHDLVVLTDRVVHVRADLRRWNVQLTPTVS